MVALECTVSTLEGIAGTFWSRAVAIGPYRHKPCHHRTPASIPFRQQRPINSDDLSAGFNPDYRELGTQLQRIQHGIQGTGLRWMNNEESSGNLYKPNRMDLK